MNEITTEERLRIVEELNRTASDSLGGESLQRAGQNHRGVGHELARGHAPRGRACVPPDDAGAGCARRPIPLLACGHDGRTEPTGGLNYCEQCGAEVTN